MRWLRWLIPSSLFGRAVATLVISFSLFAVLTFAAVVYYALAPVAQRSAQDLAAFLVLSAQTWVTLPPTMRRDYQNKLYDEHALWLTTPEKSIPDTNYFLPYVSQVEKALNKRTGLVLPVKTQVIDGRRWFWVDLSIAKQSVRVGFPRDRITTRPYLGVAVLILISLLLVLLTAGIIARRITAPLSRLAAAVDQMGKGETPEPIKETGPRELVALVNRFNQMSRQVQELMANRTTLLAGISHDLRTPLTRMTLALEMFPPDQDANLVARMRNDLGRMNDLITQSLALSRTLEGGPRESVNLAELLDSLLEGEPRLGRRYGGPCIWQVNTLALSRIVTNLLENALRYSGDSTVELRLACGAKPPMISVLDRGPGIPDEQKDAVFRPFFRLEQSRSPRTGGSGLGLAIARQLAETNGFQLQLEDRDGGGTRARVILPRDGSICRPASPL